ncbi:MAG: aldo/keto reductase [Bryobacteraceae bacterium]
MANQHDVPYTVLGSSAIRVSRICAGTMTFGNPVGAEEACRLVAHALDRGVNFFDTANAYEGYDRTFGSGGGVAEELLGRALRDSRQQAVICTKYANPVGLGPEDAGLSAQHLDRELHRSLRRLRTDYIDVVLAHRWDASAQIEEVWRVFDRWVASGKVLAVGVSNWTSWRLAQACETARRNGWVPVAVSSPKYNLFAREIESEHMPCALNYGVSLVTYQPFQGGALTGKYRRGGLPPAGSRGAEMPDWLPDLTASVFDKIESLQNLAAEACMSLPEYAIAWTLSRPGVASVVVGCRTPEQLDSAISAAAAPFPCGHQHRVDTVCPPATLPPGNQVLCWGKAGWALRQIEPGI